MKDFIRFEFLRPALKNGVRYEEFWKLTPSSLEDIIYANSERIKEEAEIQDIYNWQLGQYIQCAIASVLPKGSPYPKEPMFSKQLRQSNSGDKLSEEQIELETLKFQDFFSNLGSHIAIKKKGGGNG